MSGTTSDSPLQLPVDQVWQLPIVQTDDQGNVLPTLDGDTFTATSSDPSITAPTTPNPDTGAPEIWVTPVKLPASPSPVVTIELSDAKGLKVFDAFVQLVAPATPVPTQDRLDVAHGRFVSQAAPTS